MTSSSKMAKLFGLFLLIELTSLAVINQSLLSGLISIGLILLVLWLTLKDISFGFFALLIELILGGQGYLFKLTCGETLLSIRMLLFIIVFGVWTAKFILKGNYYGELKRIFGRLIYPYLGLLTVIALGFILGFKNHYGWGRILLDGNGYLYLLLAPVFLESLASDENKKTARFIFLGAALWLAAKTIILFIIFNYFGREGAYYLYRWVRNSGVGEITWLETARVFLQSQIFIVAAWLYIIATKNQNKKWLTLAVLTLLGTAILISLSRSFWAGLGLTAIGYLGCLALKKSWPQFKKIIMFALVSGGGAALLVFLLSNGWLGEPNRLKEDAGTDSRRAQLPVLLSAIKQNPLGYGYGKTLTYKTADPRVLAENPTGLYTTYSFELGWLDLILKLGLLGAMAYLWLFGTIFKNLRGQPELYLPLIALLIIHFFTPYLGHPLGIGLLLLISGLGQTKTTD